MPRVSVIIPTYNRRDYVQEAIDSVLAQTYTDYEIIVVDDGSTDGTGEALEARYGDRIRYVWQENQGESVARNRGIEMARGEYIAFLDSDDLWLPDKLSRQVDLLASDPGLVLVSSLAWRIDVNGRRLDKNPPCAAVDGSKLTFEALCLGDSIPVQPSTVLSCRDVLHEIGGFDPAIRYGEDVDLFLRLRLEGPFAFIDRPLACVRVHSGSQWHQPCAQTIDARLESRVRVLRRIFRQCAGQVSPDLADQALARAYRQAAVLDYAIGRARLAQQRLARAIQLDPVRYRAADGHSSDIINWASRLVCLEQVPPAEAVRNVEAAFAHWPESSSLAPDAITGAKKQLYASLVFRGYRKGDLATVRYVWPKMVRSNPFWLWNRGVWSIWFRAFVQQRLEHRLRSLMTWGRSEHP